MNTELSINDVIKILEKFLKKTLEFKDKLNKLEEELKSNHVNFYNSSRIESNFKGCYNGLDRFISRTAEVISGLQKLKVDFNKMSEESIRSKFRDLGNILANGGEYAQGSLETEFSKKIFKKFYTYSLTNNLEIDELGITNLNKELVEFFASEGEIFKIAFRIIDKKIRL